MWSGIVEDHPLSSVQMCSLLFFITSEFDMCSNLPFHEWNVRSLVTPELCVADDLGELKQATEG